MRRSPRKSVLISALFIHVGFMGMTSTSQSLAQQDQSHEFGKLRGLFNYDRGSALNLKESGLERRGEIVIRDIVFTPIPGGKEVKAFLVSPSRAGPHAGILWVHWLGEEKSD